MITGGSQPPDHIGLVPILQDGSTAPSAFVRDLEKRLRGFGERKRRVPAAEIGMVEEAFHPFEFYVSELVQQVDARAIKARKYTVLIDPANGPASLVAKELFEWVGCEVEMLNFDPSPLPDRPAACRPEHCTAAIEKTASLGCDVGLCTDPVAETVLFITHRGIPVSAKTMGAIFGDAATSDDAGRHIFAAHRAWSDGLASGLHLLEIMARRGESLDALAS
jgi:phosphomannomutase